MGRSVRTGTSRQHEPKTARLERELAQERERSSATSEALSATSDVLKAISSSTFDLQAVLETLAATATRLCSAERGFVLRLDGEHLHYTAGHNVSPENRDYLERHPVPLVSTTITGRAALERRTMHVPDVRNYPGYSYGATQVDPYRTVLSVPMCKGEHVIGVFCIYRHEVRPFTDSQVAQMESFADQAVIAIENARLLTEQRESLERQTATAEVLQVINSSPGDLAPVFDAMLDKALGLCGATFGFLWTYDGERLHVAALRGVVPAHAEFLTRTPHPVGPDNAHGRLLRGESVVHISDVRDDGAYRSGDPIRRHLVEALGGRTLLAVPLRKEAKFLGDFVIYRRDVKPFSDKQIALVQNFAAQAVIAMENARLLGELRQSLEYQTATSDVLKVISRSTFDLQPILDTLVETAVRLCHADLASINIRGNDDSYHVVSSFDYSPELNTYARNFPMPPGRGTVTGRAALEHQVVHVADVAADPEYVGSGWVTLGKVRTGLGVPLLRDGEPIGVIALFRRRVEPFTERQIELVRTFADQAVVAMENARLLGELRERQAELRVTFDNMGDGVALFDSMPRLVAWNSNFQTILDLPDALLEQHLTYVEYIRMLADRGEFGNLDDIQEEVDRRVRDLDRPALFARTRPDGKVIEARRNPVPGGGFVLIYSDITERKRAEAEISAARDAAEKALRELQAAQASLLHSQKMAALGQLTAGIAHEIKNPLNFVNNFAELSVELVDEVKEATAPLLATAEPDQRAEIDETMDLLSGNLTKIAEHGRRADGIVKSMLAHSRGGSGDWQQTDLNALIEEALNLAYHGARAQDGEFNITMERDLDRNLVPIVVVPQDLMRVLLNLLGNGFYAAHKRQRDDNGFRPTLHVATTDLGRHVEIRVRDNGIGIPPEHRDRIFQPFFTTKPTGEGTGLGLSISYDIVTQQHGGTITCDSEVGKFTEFVIRLPRNKSH